MAVDKLVDSTQLDADLTSVANAIRTKGGTSAQMAFPAGFVDAIDAIETGGGGGDMEAFMKRTIEDYEDDYPNGIPGRYINGAFPNLKRIFLSEYTWFSGSPYYQFAVTGRSDLTIVLPKVLKTSMNGCNGCTSLKAFDILLAADSNNIQQQLWYGCSNFDTLIIRTTSGVAELGNINAFANTPFASGKAGGTLYVPSALISSYQSATNWSTILGYANNEIKSIESTHTDPDAPIDLTLYYADGTAIPSA